MRWPLFLPITLLVVFAQQNLARGLAIGDVQPDLLAAYITFLALYTFSKKATLIALWATGLIMDLFSTGPMGLMAFACLATGALLARAREDLFLEHPVTQALACFFVAMGLRLLYIIPVCLRARISLSGFSITNLAYAALYSALVAPVCIGFLLLFQNTLALTGRGKEFENP